METSGQHLRVINNSVDELLQRNREIERDLANIVKLFFLYQRHIEYKLVRWQQANDMAMEFMNSVGEQVDSLRRLIEEGDDIPPSLRSSLRRDLRLNEGNGKGYQDPYSKQKFSPIVRMHREKEDTHTAQIVDDIMGRREAVVKEIQESQSALNFIMDYLRSVQNTGTKSKQAEHHSVGSATSLDPEAILATVDVDEFLQKTNRFFMSQKIVNSNLAAGSTSAESERGIRASLKKIAELQKELKLREEEIYQLREALEQAAQQSPREDQKAATEFNDLREQKDKLESKLERVVAEKSILVENDLKLRDRLTEAQNANMKLKDETTQAMKEVYSLKSEIEDLKRELTEKAQASERLRKKEETKSDLEAECQNARNSYIVLEAGYKELLKEFGELKDREIHSESLNRIVEQRIREVEFLKITVNEKNDYLESTNADLIQRNTYLEDKNTNQRKENSEVMEENCYLKTKILELQKSKSGKGEFLGDLSASLDLNQVVYEDYHKCQEDNVKLLDEIDNLRKRLFTVSADNKNLSTQNKELKSKNRNSSVPKGRQTIVGDSNLDGSKSPSGSAIEYRFGSSTETSDNSDLLNMLFLQAVLLEQKTCRQ